MEIKIRQFNTKDIEVAVPMYKKEYEARGYEGMREFVIRDRFQSMIDRAPEYCFTAVNESDEVVGVVVCYFEPYYKNLDLVIDNLLIHENYRGQGIGKLLMKEVFKKAKENNLESFTLLADSQHEFPKSWYEKLGFKPTHWVEYGLELKDFDETKL